MDKINKLTLPTTILIASVILGGFYYASQVSEQKSIEKQQENITAQEYKEYIAKRKMDCYDMYTSERERASNVENYGYIERYETYNNQSSDKDDTCEIIYKDEETGEYFRKYR